VADGRPLRRRQVTSPVHAGTAGPPGRPISCPTTNALTN
jgi:hypothetical protein